MIINCEVAQIDVKMGALEKHFKVPAFTRPKEELREAMLAIFDFAYEDEVVVSLADFAFLLLAQATRDPYQQEEPDE